MKAVDVLLEGLSAQGVEVAFGVPGGANLPLYDALPGHPIRHVLCRHEQGAGHAAEGYAKASGRVGVAIATSGPGATNLVTPITDAMLDSVPVVFIVGQVRTDLLGTDGFQEADAFGITMPVVKHSFLVRDPSEMAQSVADAFHIASSGRPGPVVLEIPQDVLRTETPEIAAQEFALAGYRPTLEGNQRQISLAAQAISLSERPVLYAGGGALDAAEPLRRLAERGNLPVTCTIMGLGAFPAPHPQWLGMPGMHGTRTANYAIDNADLLIAVGARFDDRVTGKLSEFAPSAKIIHIDVDPAEISKNRSAHIPIVGDAAWVLDALVAEISDPPPRTEWFEQINAWRREWPLSYQASADFIKPQQVIEELYRLTEGEATIVSDVGQHQMWCAQYYHYSRPRQWINSGGLGTMGFAIPAALGAQLATPERQVVAVAGDGSAIMTAMELSTIAESRIPVKIVVVNNGGYGMVRQWQEMFYDENYSAVSLGQTINWPQLSESLGVKGMTVSSPDDLEESIRSLLTLSGPALLEVKVDPDENCFPIIPPGAAARDMIG